MPDIQTVTELFARMKPYIQGLVSTMGGSGGPFAPSPHDISGAHHTGSVTDAQIPQAALLDGTRQFTGNVTIADGKTFDGVDVSAFKSTYDTHAGATAVAGHGSVGAHSHTTDATGGVLPHSGLSGVTADQHHAQVHDILGSDHSASGSAGYVIGFPSSSTLGMYETSSAPGAAAKILKTDAAGGIEIQALSVLGNITSRHLLPEATDTYDLGSSTALWRKGWLSELDAVLFAKNTRALVGGWLTIGKGEGALAAAAAAADTTMDFGQTMTTGQFVELRTSLAVEYVQVGSLVSGTTYNVTRNLDGTGANDWLMGAVYLIRGVSGDGLIDLNAYDSPRMSVIRQGATYNAQTETLRFGDLNGGWGFSAETWGAAFGAYASGSPNVIITPAKVALRNYNTDVIKLTGSGASFEAPINLGTGGGIYQGTGTFASPTTGLKIWNDSGIGRLATYNSGTAQVYFGTDGKLYAGAGVCKLDADGFSVISDSSYSNVRSYKFLNSSGGVIGYLGGMFVTNKDAIQFTTSGTQSTQTVTINAVASNSSYNTEALLQAYSNGTAYSQVYAYAYGSTNKSYVDLISKYTRISSGLWVGSTSYEPTQGCLHIEGSIRKSITVGARVYRSTDQTIGTGSWTAITFSARRWDDPDTNIWDGATALYARIAGEYTIFGHIWWASNTTGVRSVAIRLNGTTIAQEMDDATAGSVVQTVGTVWKMAAGDYVQLFVYQSSGGNLNVVGNNPQGCDLLIARIP